MIVATKFLSIFILISSLILWNSAQEGIDEEEYQPIDEEGEGEIGTIESQNPVIDGEEFATGDDPESIDPIDLEEGDVLLSPTQKQENAMEAQGRSTKAIKLKYKWFKSIGGKQVIIPYTIQGGVYTPTQLAVIQQAMWDIQNVTCVRFVKRKKHRDFFQIYSKEGHGCFSQLGRQGGLQFVSLYRNGCIYRKAIVHELIHTIGFRHMFKRFDRDKYVVINWANIKDSAKSQFYKANNKYEAFGTKFDYLSAMMYKQYAFSKNGKATIFTKDRSYQDRIGNVTTLSKGDALRINRMYKCPGY